MAQWLRAAIGRPQSLAMGIPIVALLLVLAVDSATTVRPQLSRQAVIAAALKGYDPHAFRRVEAKLMHRHDLERANPESGHTNTDDLIWVVAASGDFGIAPSFGCCSVPSGYSGHNTWGMAIIVDRPGPVEADEFETSWHGDWPPFLDQLPDLAAFR
jgi:hypothetical protein